MTTYEHAMLGLTLALAAGAHRRHGWALPVTAAVAAALPDWDAVTIFFGPEAYATGHRTWGHNLLCAGSLGALTGALGFLCYASVRGRRAAFPLPDGDRPVRPPLTARDFVGWVLMGLLAGLSHLLVDAVYPWPIPLLWPFDESRWGVAVLEWGDLPPILLFLGEMFALYYHPREAQVIAWMTMIVLSAYIVLRWWLWPLDAWRVLLW